MHRNFLRTLALAVFAAGSAAAYACAPAAAAASPQIVAQAGQCHVSLFGTIAQVVGPNEFTLAGTRVGHIHVRDNGAQMNTHGLVLRPGVYAGVYGCFTPGQRAFNAEQVTLAPSQSAYNAYTATPAVQVGPCHVSLFGTIADVRSGTAFDLQTLRSSMGTIRVDYRGSLVRANGLGVNPGVFAGVYGCLENNGRMFKADEVTLAPNAQAYGPGSGFRRPIVTANGVIDEVHAGYIDVLTRYYGHVHVYTARGGLRLGERVSVQGTFNPAQSSIDGATVSVLP